MVLGLMVLVRGLAVIGVAVLIMFLTVRVAHALPWQHIRLIVSRARRMARRH